MERLGQTLRGALSAAGVPDAGALADVTRAWPLAVGDAIARAAWPSRIARDGTLLVTTSSATWAFELGLLADEILEKLAAAVGEGAPTALRFSPGAVPAPPAADLPAEPPPGPAVDAETRRLADELTRGMTDDDLRDTIARAAAASLARAASGRRF
jgi:hypothetical protein